MLNLGPFQISFWNNIVSSFYSPSINHKDDHFAKKKTALKLDEKNKVQIWGFDFCCLSPKP